MVTKTPRNAVQSGAIVDDTAAFRRGRGRQRTAFFNAAARSVRSHVKSVADALTYVWSGGASLWREVVDAYHPAYHSLVTTRTSKCAVVTLTVVM